METLHNPNSGISFETQKQVLETSMAVLVDRISRLPQDDKDDLYLLIKELSVAKSPEEVAAVAHAMSEILDQESSTLERMPQPEVSVPDHSLENWLSYVSGQIRHFRKQAGLNQTELAEQSGLPQSHISKLENGKHSPTRITLEKIATALNIDVSEFDPNESREN
jgi:ribosome-binding protein aMBF1 (putative translation factor)